MTAVEPALFPEPEHVPARTTDGRWLIAPAPHGWRFALVGEDGEWLVIEGHGIRPEEIPGVLVLREVGMAAEDAQLYDEPGSGWMRTWCTWPKVCPTHHPPLLRDDECASCGYITDGEPGEWWVWGSWTDPAEDRATPGYFPVTVVDLEA